MLRTSSFVRADFLKNKSLTLLGGISAHEFLATYWQKKPLLIRGAIPGFTGFLDRDALLQASLNDEVESRLVAHKGNQWHLGRGPFSPKHFRRKDLWTLLVQGVNLFLPAGDQLLRKFDFIPYARLDDLMVSYATDGAGVGPHLDNYDVFLLQGAGKRRWSISAQQDHTLVDGVPLKILKNFQPDQEWVLEPGDMLYLPPQWAHDGVAVGECMTYSIGFRAAPAQELAQGFLEFLQDTVVLEGRYQDPALKLHNHAAEISKEMIDQVAAMLEKVRWDRQTVRAFLGCALTEPKPHVYFQPPKRPLSHARFQIAANKRGVVLDLRSQLLFSGGTFFLNGEMTESLPAEACRTLRKLADTRELSNLSDVAPPTLDRIYEWYQLGFINLR